MFSISLFYIAGSYGSSSRSSKWNTGNVVRHKRNDFPVDSISTLCTQYRGHFAAQCYGCKPKNGQTHIEAFCRNYHSQCNRIPCLNTSGRPSLKPGAIATTTEIPWPPNANNSRVVWRLCEKYKYAFRVICRGYEVQDLRPYCNTYRVYCLNVKPFPIIEANIGFSELWGISGIPYYPFNNEGLIMAGSREIHDFGDWGYSSSKVSGILDFLAATGGDNANWQSGSGGIASGIPLAGFGSETTGIMSSIFRPRYAKLIMDFVNEMVEAGIILRMPWLP
ncbi:unnamed protein product [Soboliphyme baturini]|uniref:Folate_rec domain-containing protein n=1 Tax=Soboliphyme baturini TaxID=241478 RepID=A0A183IHW9_9BILA|nr:unnamed protein product [Soboliphyme baturini]